MHELVEDVKTHVYTLFYRKSKIQKKKKNGKKEDLFWRMLVLARFLITASCIICEWHLPVKQDVSI